MVTAIAPKGLTMDCASVLPMTISPNGGRNAKAALTSSGGDE